MQLADFDYHLPEELIAQQALEDRAASRMLVVYRDEQRWEDRQFRELPSFLRPGDCLVLNDSKVFPARLFGHRANATGRIEVFLLRSLPGDGREWQALVRPGRKIRTGERLSFEGGLEAEVVARGEFGERTIRFLGTGDLWAAFERIGHVPLPPYIRRADEEADRERYQTVFARDRGSVAAPTAGLHFTAEILDQCRRQGAEVAWVTLHVGLGTFQPLHQEQIETAKLHTEHYRIPPETREALSRARRVVAVGTTAVRTLETEARTGQPEGETDIFLYPGATFQATGAMLTNFHLPGTSLLLLVCAFAGKELALKAYQHAVAERYRFYSYGDCMLIV
jgi:S-adenosylmethionine:tRNA ribosyltransferase-isomerase